MIIVYKEVKDGKIELTKEEFEKYLEQARKDGYDEGYKDGMNVNKQTIIYPSPTTQPTPLNPITPISPYWYCVADKNLINKIPYKWGTTATDARKVDTAITSVTGNVASSTVDTSRVVG